MSEAKAKFDVAGRVVCVTGASSGLGRQAAMTLAAAGAKVVGVARCADEWTNWTDAEGTSVALVAADLSLRHEIADTAARVAEPFGPPDIVVHAAGINVREEADDVTPEGWDATMGLNLAAPFFLTQAFVPAMKAKGWGRVVIFTSVHSMRASSGDVAYGTSHAGIGQLARSMAENWSRDGINVNAIAPGGFVTDLTEPVFWGQKRTEQNALQTCVGRNGRLADIDGPLLFLCSDASVYVTGQVLMVDGGHSSK